MHPLTRGGKVWPLRWLSPLTKTRHRASRPTSTGWYFAFALYCHSNEPTAPIGNPPDSAQLVGTPYHSPRLHPGPCSSVGMWRGTDRQTCVTNIYFAPSTTHQKCNQVHVTQSTAQSYNTPSLLCKSTETEVSWSLTSLFSTNMAISETNGHSL